MRRMLVFFLSMSFLMLVIFVGSFNTTALQHGFGTGSVATPHQTIEPVAAPQRVIVALGRIEPAGRFVNISAPSQQEPARIARVMAEEGAVVAQGEVLAVLDTEPLRAAALAEAEAAVAVRQITVARARAQHVRDRDTHAASLKRLENELQLHEWRHEQVQRLHSVGTNTEIALREAGKELFAATQALVQGRAELKRTETQISGSPLDVAAAEADLMHAKAAEEVARIRLDQAYIRSPSAGTIVTISTRPGELVGPDGFAQLAPAGPLAIRAEVYETDVNQIRTGDRIEATSPALETTLNGKVERIGRKIGRQHLISSDPAADTDARIVEVEIVLDDESAHHATSMLNLRVTVKFVERQQ